MVKSDYSGEFNTFYGSLFINSIEIELSSWYSSFYVVLELNWIVPDSMNILFYLHMLSLFQHLYFFSSIFYGPYSICIPKSLEFLSASVFLSLYPYNFIFLTSNFVPDGSSHFEEYSSSAKAENLAHIQTLLSCIPQVRQLSFHKHIKVLQETCARRLNALIEIEPQPRGQIRISGVVS